MYNNEFKKRFLAESGILPSTQKTYSFMLEKASNLEERLNKDIFEFTPYECDQLIFSFSRKSSLMVQVIVACFKRYIDFCMDNKQTVDFFNYFGTISGQVDFDRFVDMTAIENKFITFDGLEEIQKILINAQDVAFIELAFCGLNGKEGTELIELRTKDVKLDRIILPNREIPISKRTYGIIEAAIDQTEYIRGNGELADNAKGETMVINHTDFVLRSAGSTKFGQLTYSTLQMRMNRIKELFGNPYLNLTGVWHSGMLFHLTKIKQETGIVTKEDYQKINKLFGYGENYWYQSKVRFDKFL